MSVGRFCSRFELADGALAKRRITRKVMRVEHRAHARVAGDSGNLRLGASGNGESRHRCCAQVMERDANYPPLESAQGGVGGTSRHGHGLALPRLLRAVANTGREMTPATAR